MPTIPDRKSDNRAQKPSAHHSRLNKKERRLHLEEKKQVAKIGMTLSMGALVATGLMRGRGAKLLHLWSGIALIGLSAWHYHLYQPEAYNNKK